MTEAAYEVLDMGGGELYEALSPEKKAVADSMGYCKMFAEAPADADEAFTVFEKYAKADGEGSAAYSSVGLMMYLNRSIAIIAAEVSIDEKEEK